MRATPQDLPRLLEGIPDDSWVAISMEANEVVTYGEDLEQVMEASRSKGEEHPLVVKAPLFRAYLAL